MKPPSNIHACASRLSPRRTLVWLTVIALAFGTRPGHLNAQDRSWSISGSVGYARLSLDDVDGDNSADAEGWNRQGIPVGAFASMKWSPVFSGRVQYRLNREFAFSLTALYNSKRVTASYNSPEASLSLIRTVGSSGVSLGIAHFPSAQPYFLQWYLQVDMALTFARATAEAYGTRTVKVGGEPTLIPLAETSGTYKKSKVTVGIFLGADVPIVRPMFFRFEAGYRVAQFGKLGGDVTRFGEHTTETTTVEFDYSGFLLTAGVGMAL